MDDAADTRVNTMSTPHMTGQFLFIYSIFNNTL